ncbi:MAG: response regulator [Desulfovibrionaceae bacterium]
MEKELVLVIEDDEDILQLLSYNLEAAGYAPLTAGDGETGLALALRKLPQCVILDLMLPGMDGFEVCRELRRQPETRAIPVIMLTARGDEVDRVVGLEMGADDYVVKPFSPRELLLRVKAVLKRAQPSTEEAAVLRRDGLVVDVQAHAVMVDGEPVQLTATEFKLLVDLLKRQGRVQTRDHLLNTVWGYEFEGYARTVDTHIRRLRQKIGRYADYIETVRGVGYRFKA